MPPEPVHVTEIRQYLKCRLLWYWTAPPPRGLYLQPKVLSPALHLGRLIHDALQIATDRGVAPDAVFVPMALKEQERLDEDQGGLWPEQLEKLRDNITLGAAMLRGYHNWTKTANAGVTFLATETKWNVAPSVLEGLPLAGRLDGLIERDDGLWVMEYKTTSYQRVNWTRADLQATAYTIAAREMYGKDVRGVLFRFLRKKAPYTYEKLILKKGAVTSRKDLPNLTTTSHYLEALAVAVLKEMCDNSFHSAPVPPPTPGLGDSAPLIWYEEQLRNRKGTTWEQEWTDRFTLSKRAYWKELQNLKENPGFFWEVPEERTPDQIRMYAKYVLVPTMREMYHPRWVGPTGLGAAFAVCSNCAFRRPCELAMAGADFRSLLRDDFEKRK